MKKSILSVVLGLFVALLFTACKGGGEVEDPNASTYPTLNGEYYYLYEKMISKEEGNTYESPDYKEYEGTTWTFDNTKKAKYYELSYRIHPNSSTSINPQKESITEEREWKVEDDKFMFRKWGSEEEFTSWSFTYTSESNVLIGNKIYKKGALPTE